MDLTQWLLARIAEDEGAADEWHNVLDCSRAAPPPGPFPCDCAVPARVLAECAVKRAIVAEHWVSPGRANACGTCLRDDVLDDVLQDFPCCTLRLLALPYADRPGYLPEWAPTG
jgi:hypothetical protein